MIPCVLDVVLGEMGQSDFNLHNGIAILWFGVIFTPIALTAFISCHSFVVDELAV